MHTYIKFNQDHQRKGKSFKKGQVVSFTKAVCDELKKAGVATDSSDKEYYSAKKATPQENQDKPYEFNTKD